MHEQIGRLNVEREWLKKDLPRTRDEALKGIDGDHETLSIRRQCQLLNIHRSQLYYEPAPEFAENLELTRLIDELHLHRPTWGSRIIEVVSARTISSSETS